MKKTISWSDYLTLLGLFQLAQKLTRDLNNLQEAAAGILGVKNDEHCPSYYGHVSDEIIEENPSVESLLRNLDIKIKKTKKYPLTKKK